MIFLHYVNLFLKLEKVMNYMQHIAKLYFITLTVLFYDMHKREP